MTGRSDITRWNRAGLRRFQYVDANAATYLEELRVRLADRRLHPKAERRADAGARRQVGVDDARRRRALEQGEGGVARLGGHDEFALVLDRHSRGA